MKARTVTGIWRHSQDLVCTHDLEGRLLSVNAARARLLGYEVADLLKMSMQELVAPESREQFDAYLQRIKIVGVDDGLLRVVAKNGERRIWEYHNTLRTEGVASPIVRGMARDVTESKRAERALRISEQRYRMLFEKTVAGVAIVTLAGEVVDCNDTWAQMFGHNSAAECRGIRIEGYYADPAERAVVLQELRRSRSFRNREVQFRRRDGTRFWVLFNGAFISESQDEPLIQSTMVDITERKQAEEALRESQLRLTEIIATAMDAIITVDEQQRIVMFNAAAQSMFLCSETEALGLPIERFIPERFRVAHSAQIETFGKSGITNRTKGVPGSLWALRKNGEEFQMEASISRIEAGGKKLFTVILRDITERKRAEERLLESERSYRMLFESMDEGFCTIEVMFDENNKAVDYRFLDVNPAFEKQSGIQNARGRSMREIAPHHEEHWFATYGEIARTGQPARFENVAAELHRCFDVHAFRVGEPQENKVAIFFDDITNRKQSEDALRKSEERFSRAFRSNPLAITISTEADGRYLDVNDSFLNLLGYQRRDVIGRTAMELRFWSEPVDRVEMTQQLKKAGRVAKLRTRYRTVKGEIREAEVWAETIEIDGERCVLGITRDITEMHQLEAQFRQAQKMEAVGRLAGGVAHDFNNILGIIMGYSDIALGEITPDTAVRKYLAQIKKASHRAALLTRQLLAFSRQQVAFPRILDLNAVVQNVTTMLLRLVGEDIEIEFRPDPLIGSIKSDPGQIEQILMNLVVNARDAMPTGGKIIVETGHAELDEHYIAQHAGAQAGQHVVLKVSDTGCGMDEATKAHIFEPFFTTKDVGKGTGLGLSTVYGIVKQSEGYISVYSEPGKGTTFKIYFPRVNEKAEELGSPREESEIPKRVRNHPGGGG